MRENLLKLIRKYEERVGEIKKSESEDYGGCCEEIHLNANKTCAEDTLKDLRNLL